MGIPRTRWSDHSLEAFFELSKFPTLRYAIIQVPEAVENHSTVLPQHHYITTWGWLMIMNKWDIIAIARDQDPTSRMERTLNGFRTGFEHRRLDEPVVTLKRDSGSNHHHCQHHHHYHPAVLLISRLFKML